MKSIVLGKFVLNADVNRVEKCFTDKMKLFLCSKFQNCPKC